MSELQSRLFSALEKSLLALAQGLFSKQAKPSTKTTNLVIALSGGLDSSVLLHLVHAWCRLNPKLSNDIQYTLSAFHVNHGISDKSDHWESFCQQKCQNLTIPFASTQLNLSKRAQHSLEADARDARYQCLDEHANQDKIVLLAQHQDDQLETVLLQLKRGAGIEGLSAMPTVMQRDSGIFYIRPFLAFNRDDLLQYAEQEDIDWIEDESNQNTQFDRNFLRKDIVPLLKARWHSIGKTASRSAQLCAQAAAVNREYMSLLSESVVDEQDNIIIEKLQALSPDTRQSFIKYWSQVIHGLQLSYAQQQDIFALITSSKNSSGYLQFDGTVIERFQGVLKLSSFLKQNENEKGKTIQLDFSELSYVDLSEYYRLMRVTTSDYLSNNKVLAVYTMPISGVSCQFGVSNEKFKYKANRPRKKLKAWFQEWGISPLERQYYPVFSYGGQVFAVLDKISELSCFEDNTDLAEFALVSKRLA